ncbi:ParB/RepB/Spo0J family partition protein [Vibrio europaeus]|uniref:ParB/RepB/Spo0J family partition protein n=1 Tax=Vibrio europaeus TaxID=300876 RepID=UPI00233EDCCB|nr:ParB/RepB/Spo0J family partition protein [Vibrio europaeus]MDC5870211.1 ParB/RepB/Spo0J family partition protein [Vibrio europaeus]
MFEKDGGLAALLNTGDFDFQPELALASIYPDENQPRKSINSEKVQDIIDTLKQPHGRIWTPICVRQSDELGHKIIFGERRYVASLEVGKKTIPALIVKEGALGSIENIERHILMIQLLENSAREDLDIREDGRAYLHLIETHGVSKTEIAKSIGKPNSYITEAIMMSEMQTSEDLAFLNKLYDDGQLKSYTTITKLIRIARKNLEACKRLVQWAVDNDCLTRKWVDSLTNANLSDIDELIQSLEDRNQIESRPNSVTQVPQGMTGDDKAKDSTTDGQMDIDDLNANDTTETTHENTTHDDTTGEYDDSDEEQETGSGEDQKPKNEQESTGTEYETVKTAHVMVLYNEKMAELLINRRDREEGFAWINVDEENLRVSIDEITLLSVG